MKINVFQQSTHSNNSPSKLALEQAPEFALDQTYSQGKTEPGVLQSILSGAHRRNSAQVNNINIDQVVLLLTQASQQLEAARNEYSDGHREEALSYLSRAQTTINTIGRFHNTYPTQLSSNQVATLNELMNTCLQLRQEWASQ